MRFWGYDNLVEYIKTFNRYIIGFMFIIRFPYSHQYKRVIVIVYWSEYPDDVIVVFLVDTF